jgi:hypothetical protein
VHPFDLVAKRAGPWTCIAGVYSSRVLQFMCQVWSSCAKSSLGRAWTLALPEPRSTRRARSPTETLILEDLLSAFLKEMGHTNGQTVASTLDSGCKAEGVGWGSTHGPREPPTKGNGWTT